MFWLWFMEQKNLVEPIKVSSGKINNLTRIFYKRMKVPPLYIVTRWLLET